MIFQHSILFISASILVIALAQQDYYGDESRQPGGWDPTSRDFTARCRQMADLAGPRGCDLFLVCCSEGQVLNKLNGDKCQEAEPSNGCRLDQDESSIAWAQCKAKNCTAEITTTTTTTLRPSRVNSASLLSVTISTSLLFVVALMFIRI